jgi:predicted dehydrogenase
MNKKVRIAVVGLRHGCEHLEHYRGRQDVEIVGLCDVSDELTVETAAIYGVPKSVCYTDYSAMLHNAKPDAVFVMTPVPLHAPMTIQALEAGCHVLVAKSLCQNLADGNAMIKARNEAGKHVEVGFQMHHAAIYRYLYDHVNDPEFGELRSAWIQFFYPTYWRDAGNWQNHMDTLGGALLDCCIHSMDALLYILKRPWTRVFASGRQFMGGPADRDTMDATTVLIDLEGGQRLTIDQVDCSAYCFVRTGVVGSLGKFELEHWEPNGSGHVRFHANVNTPDPVKIWVPPIESSTGHIGIVEQSLHFLEICKGNAEPLSTLESAMESLSAQKAIVNSLRQEKWISRGEI